MYEFDKNVVRRNTESTKWDLMGSRFGSEDLLPFWIADMDFPVMPELVKAITDRAAHPSYGYSFASQAYYDNFIRWNRERNRFTVRREQMLSVPGVVCAFAFTIYALVPPNGRVMFCSPVYDPFGNTIRGMGRQTVASSLKERDGYYTMDFDDLERKLAEGVDLFVLCNPHNPVGRVWTEEELRRVGELCLKYRVPVFSDDIHSDLIMPGRTYTPLPAISREIADNTVLAMAPSKTFNIAGLKSSVMVISNPELRKKIDTGLQAFHMGVDLIGLKATEAAYGIGAPWVDELTAYLLDNARAVVEFCRERLPGVRVRIPEATYLMWLNFSAYGLSQEELMEKLRSEARVALNDGSHYGPEAQGWVRLNIGTARSMLMQGLEQIAGAFQP